MVCYLLTTAPIVSSVFSFLLSKSAAYITSKKNKNKHAYFVKNKKITTTTRTDIMSFYPKARKSSKVKSNTLAVFSPY